MGRRLSNLSLLFILVFLGCTASLESFDVDDEGSNPQTGANPGDDGSDSSGSTEGLGPDENIQLTATLQCSSLSWCTNYRGRDQFVAMPENTGGRISDGIYMAQAGSLALDVFVFENGNYSEIQTSLVNAFGVFDTVGDKLITTMEASCSHNGTFESANPEITEYTYSTNGDDLYLKRPCNNPNCSDSATYYRRTDSICNNIEDYECRSDGECFCRQFVEQDIPETLENGISCNL